MEKVDIYNNEREIVSSNVERWGNLANGEHCIFVFLCLFNQEGKMLIQKRSASKEIYPSLWDFSAGGAVQSGETSYQAIIRETKEEIGFDLQTKYPKPSFSIYLQNYICDYYIASTHLELNEFKFASREIDVLKWASYEEIIELIDTNEFLPYHKSLIKFLFDTQNMPYSRLNHPVLF
ncbi:NUDIX hydrolase [Mycoplasma simbae]|uniref:NUDIX hydrolase n=1 Tax=Mycoplasma simbae TaxID=36744 RepID=UPI0006904681|nr:NUDIX domain-containing protein [Mycoplasma simbae]